MDIKLISTKELIRELKSRYFVTDLLFGIEDVKRTLKEFNDEQDTPIELSHKEMVGVLKTLSNRVEDVTSEINNELWGTISDIYEIREGKFPTVFKK